MHLGIACVLALVLVAGLPAPASHLATSPGRIVLLPYLATGYRYKVVPHDGDQGFEQPGFDDSGWSVGDAGFGSPSGICPFNNPDDVKTVWPGETDILLRKTFDLPEGAFAVKVGIGVDNDVQVFINGQDISDGLQLSGDCRGRDTFIFDVPQGILTADANLLAVRGRDRGEPTFLDVQVTAAIPPPNDDFDSATIVGILPFTDTAETVGATTSADDPSCFGNGATVWYSFVAPGTMRLSADTFGSSYNTTLSVYSGSRGALQQVDCNDDAGGGIQSQVKFTATGGVTYFFMVADRDSVGGMLSFALERTWLTGRVQLSVSSRSVVFKRPVTVTAHLDQFADASNKVLEIYQTPFRGSRQLVKSAAVDVSGDLSVTVRPTKHTTFQAAWVGDELYEPATSRTVTVKVKVIVATVLRGHYGKSGKFKLYRFGDVVIQIGRVKPKHRGRLEFMAQRKVGGRWQTVAEASFRLRNGVAVAGFGAPSRGDYRFRNAYASDRDHLGNKSRWAYARAT